MPATGHALGSHEMEMAFSRSGYLEMYIILFKKNKLTEQNEMPQIKLHRHPVVQTLDLGTLHHNSQQLRCPEQ